MSIPSDARWQIRAFIGRKHEAVQSGHAHVGDLLMHLWFKSDHSMHMDRDIFRERIKRGDVSHFDIIDMVNHTTERHYS